MVYNKKGFPFVSDYKRDIFDKYTLIYWIQESYPSIFVFFSGDTFVWKAYLDIFAKKNIGFVLNSQNICIFAPANENHWAMV